MAEIAPVNQGTPYPKQPSLTWTVPTVSSRANLEKSASKVEERIVTGSADGQLLPVIYGIDYAGGMVAGAFASSTRLWLLVVWCHGEIDSVLSVTMNDEAVPSGVYRWDKTGAAGQTVESNFANAYYAKTGKTFTDTMSGVAYSTFSVPHDECDSFPEFVARIKGLKVAPSSGGTKAWSDSPALCIADFRENTVYGAGRSINWTDVGTVKAANETTVNGEQARKINLTLLNEQTVEAWTETLCAYAGCWARDEGGTLELVPCATSASVYTFTADNIVAGSMKISTPGPDDIPTVMRVRYTDTSATPPRDAEAIAYAAGVLAGTTPWRESTVDMPGVNRYTQALREATERLNMLALTNVHCAFSCFDVGLKLQLYNVITVTHPIGLSSVLFRIVGLRDVGFGRYNLTCAKYDANVWSGVVVSEPTPIDTGLSISGTPPTLAGLSAAEEVYRTGDGLISTRLRLSWTDPAWSGAQYVLVTIYDGSTQVHSGYAWTNAYVTPPLQEGTSATAPKNYTVEVRLISRAGVAGAATSVAANVYGKWGVLPGNVPSLVATEAGGKVYARWTAATDLDTLDYELRYGSVGVSWDNATYLQRIAALAYTIEGIPPGTWDILIKARDSYKQYSPSATTVSSLAVTLDSTAAQLGNKTFSSPTVVQMDSWTIDGVTYWATDNNENWDYGYTGANWNSDSRTNNVWNSPTSSTGSSWTSEAWDLLSTVAATISVNINVSVLLGSAAVSLGYSTTGSTAGDMTWIVGQTSAKVVARYVMVKVETAAGDAVLITGPVTATATGMLRKESGTVLTVSSGVKLVQLASNYAQTKSVQMTAPYLTSNNPAVAVYDRVIVHPETGLSFQTEHTAGANAYTYWQISTAARTITAGDYLEFDVFVDAASADVSSTSMIGGFEVEFNDATNARSLAVVDQVSIGMYGYSAATNGAAGQWVHRKCSLTPCVGKVVSWWGVVCESNTVGTHRAIYKNIKVTDGGSTTRLSIWSSGEPTANTVGYAQYSQNRVVGPSNSFIAYCFDSTNAQVAATVSYTFEGA